jgi:hypothetical protein
LNVEVIPEDAATHDNKTLDSNGLESDVATTIVDNSTVVVTDMPEIVNDTNTDSSTPISFEDPVTTITTNGTLRNETDALDLQKSFAEIADAIKNVDNVETTTERPQTTDSIKDDIVKIHEEIENEEKILETTPTKLLEVEDVDENVDDEFMADEGNKDEDVKDERVRDEEVNNEEVTLATEGEQDTPPTTTVPPATPSSATSLFIFLNSFLISIPILILFY